MKSEKYVKIILDPKKQVKKLVSVCAWCPKEDYPHLNPSEDYTHGLCEKHYQELRRSSKYNN